MERMPASRPSSRVYLYTTRFRAVPPARVALWSVRCPYTGAKSSSAVRRLWVTNEARPSYERCGDIHRASRSAHQPQLDTTNRRRRGERENVYGRPRESPTRRGVFHGVVWMHTRVGIAGRGRFRKWALNIRDIRHGNHCCGGGMDSFGMLVSRSVEAAAMMAAQTAMCLQAEWPEAEVVHRGCHFEILYYLLLLPVISI